MAPASTIDLHHSTVMGATVSFDHRAIDGAELMQMFKTLVEAPLGLVA